MRSRVVPSVSHSFAKTRHPRGWPVVEEPHFQREDTCGEDCVLYLQSERRKLQNSRSKYELCQKSLVRSRRPSVTEEVMVSGLIVGNSYVRHGNNCVMKSKRKGKTVDIFEMYEKLCLLTIFERHTYMTVLLTRSLLLQSDKLQCIVEIMRPEQERNRRLNLLILPAASGFYQDSYQLRAAKIWNKLPQSIHKLGIDSFKNKLNEWIIRQRHSETVSH